MNTLGDVIKTTQSLLGDPDGEWVTRDYILPLINQAYRSERIAIKNASGRNLENTVELLNVDIGTTSLYPFQATGKPLQGLYDPLKMWWKMAGQPWSCYTPAFPKNNLPFVGAPGTQPNALLGTLCWTWMGLQLKVTPVASAIDILVEGRFNPPPLVQDQDILVLSPDLEAPLSFHSAAIAGVERTNPGLLASYQQMGDSNINDIVAQLIREKSSFPKRLGRQAPTLGWRWVR